MEDDGSRAQRRAETLAGHFRTEVQQVSSSTLPAVAASRGVGRFSHQLSTLTQDAQISRVATGASARLKVAVIGAFADQGRQGCCIQGV